MLAFPRLTATTATTTTNNRKDKLVNFVSHEVAGMHRWFAGEFLLRRNPYRGNLSFAEDPAVAMVEITNENGIFMGADRVLSAAPQHYARELQANFSEWLAAKYGTTEALRAAWAAANPRECAASLTSRVCRARPGAAELVTRRVAEWRLAKTTGDAAVRDNGDGSATVEGIRASEKEWHLELTHGGLRLDDRKTYAIVFAARSLGGQSRPLRLGISMDVSPWDQVAQ